MTLDQLKQRLRSEGYGSIGAGPLIYESGPHLLAIQDFRIERTDGTWRVCDTERGEIVLTHLVTPDESEACRYFHDSVGAMMLFLAGFGDSAAAARVERALREAGLEPWRNDVPAHLAPDGRRYRLFVRGRDLARARPLVDRVDEEPKRPSPH